MSSLLGLPVPTMTDPRGGGEMRAAVRPLSLRTAEQVAEVVAAGMVGWWTQLSWTCCNRELSRPRAERGRGARVGSAAICFEQTNVTRFHLTQVRGQPLVGGRED
jgi:hypothetical protein